MIINFEIAQRSSAQNVVTFRINPFKGLVFSKLFSFGTFDAENNVTTTTTPKRRKKLCKNEPKQSEHVSKRPEIHLKMIQKLYVFGRPMSSDFLKLAL